MARSAHAYVRGNTEKFYKWLDSDEGMAVCSGNQSLVFGTSKFQILAIVQEVGADRALVNNSPRQSIHENYQAVITAVIRLLSDVRHCVKGVRSILLSFLFFRYFSDKSCSRVALGLQ